MGFSSPLHNVKGNSVGRPPVIIFVICVLVCAFATLAMGFFVQFSESVANPEVKERWMTFLSHLNAFNFCVSVPKTNEYPDPGPITRILEGATSNATEEVSITVSASVSMIGELKKLPPGIVAARGSIYVKGDWAVFDDINHPLKVLELTFVVPPGLDSTHNKDACLIFTVPSTFLPLSTKSSVCVPSLVNKTVTHVGTISFLDTNDTNSICKTGAYLKLNFKKDLEYFYLSKTEKWNIYSRLVHFSYFLFTVAFLLVFFSLFRSRSYTSVVIMDKVPLSL